MFNLFRKKKQITTTPQKHPVEKTLDEERENTTNYIFNVEVIPQEYRQNKMWIKQWFKVNGDYVNKGEVLCELDIEELITNPINIESPDKGFLEIFKQSPTLNNRNYLHNNEKVFSIHREIDKILTQELRDKRFENIPIIRTDDFKGTKEIEWEIVAGQRVKNPYLKDFLNSFRFLSDDENSHNLMFTLNNLENKDFIVFKFSTKQYKLTVGSKVSFLFDNGEIHEFEITTKPYKHSEHSYWGHIFETRVQIRIEELKTLKTQQLSKWQIEIGKDGKKISGVIDSSDTQFSLNKFAKEYCELVNREITNYQPFTDKKSNINKANSDNEECYVYLMIDLKNNYHKIGISNKPEYREKTLQSEKPTIEMLCSKWFPNRKIANSFEQALHQVYADKRVRGEWFDLSENEIKELKETLTT